MQRVGHLTDTVPLICRELNRRPVVLIQLLLVQREDVCPILHTPHEQVWHKTPLLVLMRPLEGHNIPSVWRERRCTDARAGDLDHQLVVRREHTQELVARHKVLASIPSVLNDERLNSGNCARLSSLLQRVQDGLHRGRRPSCKIVVVVMHGE